MRGLRREIWIVGVLVAAFAMLGREAASAWPPDSFVCSPPLSAGPLPASPCTYPRPQWRTPFAWTLGGMVVGLLLALVVVAIIRWHKPVVWASACVVFGAVGGFFEGATSAGRGLAPWTGIGAGVGLLLGVAMAAAWVSEASGKHAAGPKHYPSSRSKPKSASGVHRS